MDETLPKVASIGLATPSLLIRVQRKRELLQQWLDHGIPHDKLQTLPTSLNKARTWHDPDLGIFAIGSASGFTTTHPDVGRDVKAINLLITKLQAKVKRPRVKRKSESGKPKLSANEIEEVITSLVSQWQMAREEAGKQRLRAELAEKHRDLARDALQAREADLAELRRQLTVGPKLVK